MPKTKLSSKISKPTDSRIKKKVTSKKTKQPTSKANKAKSNAKKSTSLNTKPLLMVLVAFFALFGVYILVSALNGTLSAKYTSFLLNSVIFEEAGNERLGLKKATDGPCKNIGYQVQNVKSQLCTHGFDEVPVSATENEAVPVGDDVIKSNRIFTDNQKKQLLKLRELENSGKGPAATMNSGGEIIASDASSERCEDGHSEGRVVVVYLGSLGPRHMDAIRDYARMIDFNVIVAANKTGHRMRVRWVREDCTILVARSAVVTNPERYTTVDRVIRKLEDVDFNRDDRKYLVFVDTILPGNSCGVGTSYDDDDPNGFRNSNNFHNAQYAIIWKECWSGTAPTHELFHTLGAVQDSAPHYDSSGSGGHTTQGKDIMTPYPDGGNRACSNITIDCGSDDYFNPKPSNSSAAQYIRTHWNTARSRYLIFEN